jgi:hypothetical protein
MRGFVKQIHPDIIAMKKHCFLMPAVLCLSANLISLGQNPGAVGGAKLWLKANTGVEVTDGNKASPMVGLLPANWYFDDDVNSISR